MMKSGTGPTLLDRRDLSFHRTFGALSQAQIDRLPPQYDNDAGLTMPDQNILDPFSCTGYTTCDCGTDQDGTVYSPKYTYMKTLFLQGLPPTQNGSDIRPALKTASVYGLLPIQYMPEDLASKDEDYTADQGNWPHGLDAISGKLEHRKGKYFNVYDDGGLDWFDSFRSALWLNRADKRSISVGTPWICTVGDDGIMDAPPQELLALARSNPVKVGWHNWKCSGWTAYNSQGKLIRDGEIFLRCKAWQGVNFGDNGWAYISRAVIQQLMDVRGSVAFTQKDATEADLQTIKLGMFEAIALYLSRILGLKRYA